MRGLVVYESMFGNTKQVADAIGEGVRSQVATELVEVNDAPREIGADVMLVVGGPTHAFGMTRAKTRQDAMTQAGKDPASAGIGLREWLESLDHADDATRAAAFDTHIDKRVPGSAARAAEKRLRKLGFRIVEPAESFYVSGTPGPLVQGELERARRWGELLGASLPETATGELSQPSRGTR